MKRYKYLLALSCLFIISHLYSQKNIKRKGRDCLEIEGVMKVTLSGEHYRQALQEAIAACMISCDVITESRYINKNGFSLFKQMLQNLSVSPCSGDVIANEYHNFLDFYAEVKRKIDPAVYEWQLGMELEELTDAFNRIQEQRKRDKKRRSLPSRSRRNESLKRIQSEVTEEMEA